VYGVVLLEGDFEWVLNLGDLGNDVIALRCKFDLVVQNVDFICISECQRLVSGRASD
jgi:hypothetical protein